MSRVTAEERGRRQTAFVGRGEKRTARGATEQNRFGRSQETGETEARTPGERTGGRESRRHAGFQSRSLHTTLHAMENRRWRGSKPPARDPAGLAISEAHLVGDAEAATEVGDAGGTSLEHDEGLEQGNEDVGERVGRYGTEGQLLRQENQLDRPVPGRGVRAGQTPGSGRRKRSQSYRRFRLAA